MTTPEFDVATLNGLSPGRFPGLIGFEVTEVERGRRALPLHPTRPALDEQPAHAGNEEAEPTGEEQQADEHDQRGTRM